MIQLLRQHYLESGILLKFAALSVGPMHVLGRRAGNNACGRSRGYGHLSDSRVFFLYNIEAGVELVLKHHYFVSVFHHQPSLQFKIRISLLLCKVPAKVILVK